MKIKHLSEELEVTEDQWSAMQASGFFGSWSVVADAPIDPEIVQEPEPASDETDMVTDAPKRRGRPPKAAEEA